MTIRQNGPWKVTNTKQVYENHWLSVREDEVIHPDGKPGIFGVATLIPGVSILPIDDDGNVYLIEEYRYAVEHLCTECASGAIEKGQTPLEAAKRELHEEAGFEADEWLDVGCIDPFTSVTNAPHYLFIAKKLHNVGQQLESSEMIKVVKFTLDDAYQMVLDGHITFSPACILILRAKLLTLGK